MKGTPSVLALVGAAAIFVGSLAAGLVLRDRGNETVVTTEVVTVAGADGASVERMTVTETSTPMWWTLVLVGGAVAAAGLVLVAAGRAGDPEDPAAADHDAPG